MQAATQKKLNLVHRGWSFVRLLGANSATLTEVPSIPRKLRPKEKVPDPKIPEWPKPEWPKEFQDLCKEFEDVLVEELDIEQVVRCPPIDVELLPGTKPFFCPELTSACLMSKIHSNNYF